MKSRLALTAAALALSAGVAQAQYLDTTVAAHSNHIHGGAMTFDDQALLAQVMNALATDRELKQGVTATVVVKNGQVTLSGSSETVIQAARAEKLAKDIAGSANVVGTLYPGNG